IRMRSARAAGAAPRHAACSPRRVMQRRLSLIVLALGPIACGSTDAFQTPPPAATVPGSAAFADAGTIDDAPGSVAPEAGASGTDAAIAGDAGPLCASLLSAGGAQSK